MGKSSREKRLKKEQAEQGLISRPQESFEETGLNSVCLRIIQISVYLILFTPLIISSKFYFPFVGPKSLYFMGLAQIIFFTWLFLAFNSPRYRPKFNLVLGVLIIFLVSLILSSLSGVSPFYSFWSKYERMTGILMWFHLLAFFLAISSVFRKSKDWRNIFIVSAFVAIIISLISLLDKSGAKITNLSFGGATLGNSSFLATYLLFNVFFAIHLFFKNKDGIKIYSGIAFIIIAITLILSGGRAANVAFFAGLSFIFFIWLLISKRGILKWLAAFLLLLFFFAGISGVFVLVQSKNPFSQMVLQKLNLGTIGARLVVWDEAKKGIQDRPLFGWGPENFEYAFSKYYNPCFGAECGGDLWYDRAHNIIFDTLIATGILGFILYLGIFGVVFWVLWRNFFRNNTDFWTTSVFTALLISYFVQNLTVFDMAHSYLMWFLVLGFAASISIKGMRRAEDIRNPAPKIKIPNVLLATIILILFITVLFKFVINPLRANSYVISALKAQPVSPERLYFYEKTLETASLGKNQIREFFAQTTTEFAYSGNADKVPQENLKEEFDFVIRELEKSTKEFPLDLKSYLRLGQLYNAYTVFFDPSSIELADKTLKKALELSPTNQQVYWALIQTRLLEQKPQEAVDLAQKAISLDKNMQQSYAILMRTARAIGDMELAKRTFEEAIAVNPLWEKDLKKIIE